MNKHETEVLSGNNYPGSDFYTTISRSIASASPQEKLPYLDVHTATIHIDPVDGASGIDAGLLDKLIALSHAGWAGIPYDVGVDAWLRRHGIAAVMRGGRLAVRKGWKLSFRHAGALIGVAA